MQMNRSNKIENLANRYVERHIKDKHLSNDTIKEIKIAYIMVIKDFIAIGDRDSARPKGCHIMYIWFIIKR